MNEEEVNTHLEQFTSNSGVRLTNKARDLLLLCLDAIESDPNPSWEANSNLPQLTNEMTVRLPSFLFEIWHDRPKNRFYDEMTTFEVLHWLGENLTKICPIQKDKENFV